VVPTLLRTPAADGGPQIHLTVQAGRTSVLELVTAASSDDSIAFDKLEVSSEAVLRNGQTLILSGLSQRESRSVESGVPILRSIPVLKYLFSQTTTVQSDTAVVILLTPRDPAFADQRYRADLKEFVARRKAFVEARRQGDDAVKQLRAEHPDWFEVAPNRFASHFFLMRTSDLYRSVSGLDLPVEGLVLDLLQD
jgi:type II secretory pathway component GspD/PulD (secretin)